MLPMPRTIALVLLLAATASAAASQPLPPMTTPTAMICHDEATRRYIEDFRRVGAPRRQSDDRPAVSTTFVNDNPRYEDYFAECKGRWNAVKAR